MITHSIESYWIPGQMKTKPSYKFKEFTIFLNFEKDITRDTPSEVAW